ncbi:MAG: nitrous oxide reductase family maturation protein NosD [Phycisphaerae bacterium]
MTTRHLPSSLPALFATLTLLAAASAARATTFDLRAAIETARAGATIHVPPGTYPGPLTINKPLALIADGNATIAGNGKGHVLIIRADDVTIRGFHIQGTGIDLDHENAGVSGIGKHLRIENNTLSDVLFGIYLQSAPNSIIRNNTIGGKNLDLGRRGDAIRLWNSPDATVEANHVTASRDVIMWFSNHVHVLNNVVTNSRYGLHFMYSDNDLLEGNLLQGNSVGTYMMYSHNLTLRNNRFLHNRGPSGYGIGLKSVDGLDARDNLFDGNRVGLYIDDSPSRVDVHHTFRHNTFLVNDIGIAFLPNVCRNTFTENNFIDNYEQVAVLGGGELHDDSFSKNGRGNFWSDYRGYSLHATGVGDLPYRSENLFENLMDREPKLRLFLFSPAQQAVQMAAQAFPVFRPKAKFVDDHPLMAPLGDSGETGSGWSGWLLAAGAACAMLALRARRSTPAAEPLSCPPSQLRCPVANPAPDANAPTVLRVANLTKKFGPFTALNDLSLHVRRGEALALWGSNGAGKTTAIKCILGLLRGKGAIEVCGKTLAADSKAVRRAIGYVPQELDLYDDLTARQALAFFASLKRAPKHRIDDVLAEVGLSAHANKSVRALSGGMKQRLALAIALLADPPLLLLDEMTSNLDAAARQEFVQLLNHQKRAGKTILFITHRLEEIETLADRVLVLDRGQQKVDCRADELPAALGLRSRLKVIVPEESLDDATALLTRAGYSAARNGRGVYVHVLANRKADPMKDLLARGIRVHDFELDETATTLPPTARSPHGTL